MRESIDILTAWLLQPDYDQGVTYYEQFIGTGFVLRMLQQGDDEYNQERLYSALEAKLSELRTELENQVSTYPESLSEQLEAAKLLMDERTILKERLREQYRRGITYSVDSHQWALRILSIGEQIDATYGRRRFFDSHGYLPDVATLDTGLTPADLIKRRNTVRTYRTKLKQALETAFASEDLASLTSKLNQYQAELHDLDQQLSALQT